jgi:hypothetical protein
LSYFFWFYVGYSFPLWLYKFFFIFTVSTKLNSILLQQNISKLSRYFWSIFRSFKVQQHAKLCSTCSSIVLVSSLTLSPICSRKDFLLLSAAFAMEFLDLILPVHFRHMPAGFPDIWNILYLTANLLYHILYWEVLLWGSHHLNLFHIHCHSRASSNFIKCLAVPFLP